MRRATRTLILAASTLALAAVSALSAPQLVERVNGIGLVDYSRPPQFKVGDWVKYRMTGQSAMGMSDDYELTILIAGEEVWWGEECFWVETWTDAEGRPPQTAATLMSYAIFSDSGAIQRMQNYQRKSFAGVNPDGSMAEELVIPASSSLKSRKPFQRPMMWDVDTLEADTVQTPVGLLQCRKVSIRQGTGVTSNMPDSTLYTEVRENRMSWMTPQVPITHVAREDVENLISRRSWFIGRSAEGSGLRIIERGTGTARLVAYGHGLESRALPAERRTTLAQLRALEAKRPGTAAPARPRPRKR